MDEIKELTIKELLSGDEYRIPIYQRNYAWGIREVTQLVQDVADYAKETPANNYYIGNLIVFPRTNERHVYYETIDGQQRTTTLTILMCALKHECHQYDFSWYSKMNISFDHRDKSNSTLTALFNHSDVAMNPSVMNTDIWAIYKESWSVVIRICEEKELEIPAFMDYFLNKVILLRTCVPKDTNLNHYFEIMNSRGEQLEQHEVVKARLMSAIKEDHAAMVAFNMIWEACSNMDRYVQLNFPKNIRAILFSNDGTGEVEISFEALKNAFKGDSSDEEEKSLESLFREAEACTPYEKPWENQAEEDQPEAFHSLITFSNFLLHVLKVLCPQDKDVVLDDKRLTGIFSHVLDGSSDKAAFSLEFIMRLLELRCVFDKYVIKRKQDKWSLKKLLPSKSEKGKYYYADTFSSRDSEDDNSGQNRGIIQLLSMFHVSAPTQIYKHWMNACLYFMYQHKDANAETYRKYLWNLSKAYMLDRYLASNDKKVPFETIIYGNNGESVNKLQDVSWANINIDEHPLKGEQVENFVFNFYDYILWQKSKDADFEFAYRTSVEHFYPQHPTDKKPMDFEYLHSFGNLCLVSRGMNSKFTNNLPKAKYENFGSAEAMKTYSLKLRDMMNCMKKGEIWDETMIMRKEQEAKNLISEVLS